MRGIIWLVLLFVVAVVAATTLGRNDGLVSIYFGAWRTDLSLNLFLLAMLNKEIKGTIFGSGNPRYDIPALLSMFARLGEQTGQLPLMLQRASVQLSAEVQRRAMALATLLEPLLIVAMGGMVMLIVLAVLLPIIQLNQWVK